MAFLDETAKLLGLEPKFDKTCLYVSPQKGVVVEGYNKIVELAPTKVVLLIEDAKQLIILGNNLEIKEISYKELTIRGELVSINFS